MVYGDVVIDCDGVEFFGDVVCCFDFVCDKLV